MSLAVARYWPWRMSDTHLVRCISAWIVCGLICIKIAYINVCVAFNWDHTQKQLKPKVACAK